LGKKLKFHEKTYISVSEGTWNFQIHKEHYAILKKHINLKRNLNVIHVDKNQFHLGILLNMKKEYRYHEY